MANEKSIPIGVKIIAILYLISAVFGIFFGLLLLIGVGTTFLFSRMTAQLTPFMSILFSLYIIVGATLIVLGVFNLFVGIGLWKAKQ